TVARRKRQSIGMSVGLKRSFDFLLPKEDAIPEWVQKADEPFFAFLAGYIDAEGYVKTCLPRGYKTLQVRIEVRSYEARLLTLAGEELNRRGIACPQAGIRVEAGYVNKRGIPTNGVTWGLGI